MSSSQELLDRRSAVVSRGVPRVTRATVAHASGATLVDLEGNEIIDFAGGIGVMTAGHCDEAVVAAIREQAGQLLHTCFHIATYEPYVALCEKLVELLPHGDSTKAMLVNSGAEAVENAVKIARQATGQSAVICYTDAFHGRTLLGMSLTSKVGYKSGCGPFAPEIYRLPYPNHYRDGDGLDMSAFVERELSRVRTAFTNTVAADEVAAILIEPVAGEGGFLPAPRAYLEGLREICDEHGIVLIFDEVQTGFCRTGGWGAYQQLDVVPDLSTWAKAMGGGLPIAAVVGRADVMDAVKPGTLGGTYGGNPVACAAALATIRVMEEKNLNQRARQVGEILRRRFESMRARCPAVDDVRGMGAMVGIELVEDVETREPASSLASDVTRACLDRGLLLLTAGTAGNVIRVLVPLVIPDDQLTRGLDILEEELLARAGTAGPESRLSLSTA
jgi:4-aminobutyrate aminotransferase / (S)-3-amino-2-methylpropionate transaminase / 5-aminovalerate transaminase